MFKVYNPYLMALIATVGGMLFGFDISSVSAFVGQEEYRRYFGYPNSVTQGGITASMAGGSFLGSLFVGPVSDRLGRRLVIRMSSCIWMIGAAIQCSSQNKGQLIAGRTIAGVGIGFASSQIPVYVAELSPKNIRGRLVGCFQWSVTWGIMIMFYIGYGCSFIKGPASFRTAWGIQMVPGFILLLGTYVLPESPRWLASKDRWEEAIDIIAHVQAKGNDQSPVVQTEIEDIREEIEIQRQYSHLTVFDLFRKGNLNRTMVGISAQVWQQMTGINVMMYYIVILFEMAGYSGNANLVSSSIQYIINVVMTVPALLFIDTWGRRPLLIAGSILMMGWLFAVAGLMSVYGTPINNYDGNDLIRLVVNDGSASKGIIACSYLFVATFAPTWGPGIWIYVSEIFPTSQRALGNGVCASANWIFNFALAMFVPSAFKNITWKTYIIFGVMCICMSIHVFLMFPETKGKTLEEINLMWESNVPAWQSHKWQPPVHANNFLSESEEKEVTSHQETSAPSPIVTNEPTA
ncbi:uncharacterized protein SAPINGB_P000615 [Magnusiomyces paraingens]|uniref:Major facilitator superfamily (MFS) profile domain-containing protein n=1 Tax=Magnusiomyces paraingens TaxID=2606893 RepID=A0A5E8B5Z4_9ASCO|nr:uncharacterized protein SAPINGB_P000615 [Saprochaete ingens]VVT45033.1 unnamed protein product [Saprochaete ingens]